MEQAPQFIPPASPVPVSPELNLPPLPPPPAATPPTTSQKDPVDFGNPFDEEKTLLEWRSPERLHKIHGRDYYTTAGAFVFLLTIIAIFFREVFLVIVIWAVAFLAYSMSRTTPQTAKHKLTNRGVKTGRNKYLWSELARFWFDEKWGQPLLLIDTFRPFPGRLTLLLGDTPKDKVKQIMVKRIPYDKPEDTFADRAARWLQDKIPLEEDKASAPLPPSPSHK